MSKRKQKKKKPSFVIDSSMALAWCFPDERAEYPSDVLDSLASSVAFVPAIWHLEIANALLVGERRKRCSQKDSANWTNFLALLPLIVDEETLARAWTEILSLGRSHNLSAYDAAYLELALKRDLPLASLDDKLKRVAMELGIPSFTP